MDQTRPRTRGLEASEAEEDAKFIKAALKEPEKFIKKAHQKLKNDYNRSKRNNDNSDDEEEKLFYQQPPFDDDEEEVAKHSHKRRRGGGRRGNFRRRVKADGGDGEEGIPYKKPVVSARLAALLKEELAPKIEPYNHSAIQYKHVWYKLGDVVSVQKEETKYYAQILGFHTDQFCERYASIQWLLPKWKMNADDLHLPPITMESFRGTIPEDRPVSMNCFRFVFRPQAYHLRPEYPKTVTRDRYFVLNNERIFFDSPSSTLTSAERRY